MLSRRDFLYLAGSLPVCAQEFSTGVNVVNVFATVRDNQGKIILDLLQDDFTIQEDGRPQAIRYFSRQSDLPLSLGLLLDTSGSVSRVLEQERTASFKFFQHILREDKDQAFLIHFDYEVELLQDLTSSRKKLEEALRDAEPGRPSNPRGRIRTRIAGGTTLYDAVYLAADEILRKKEGRKAVVLLSDGVDQGSRISLSTAIESAQRADMLVYSILFSDGRGSPASIGFPPIGGRGGRRGRGGSPFPQPLPPGRGRPDGKTVLQRISQETGGAYFEVSRGMPLEKIYDQIEEELRNQYSLGYTPDRVAAGYHRILVSVKRKNTTVRTRDGYYT